MLLKKDIKRQNLYSMPWAKFKNNLLFLSNNDITFFDLSERYIFDFNKVNFYRKLINLEGVDCIRSFLFDRSLVPYRLAILNGSFIRCLSKVNSVGNIFFSANLKNTFSLHYDKLRFFFQENSNLNNSFLSLNILYIEDIVFLYVSKNIQIKDFFHILVFNCNFYYRYFINSKIIIYIDDNSILNLLEEHIGLGIDISNFFCDIFLGKGSLLNYHNVVSGNSESKVFSHIRVIHDKYGRLKKYAFFISGKQYINNRKMLLNGNNSAGESYLLNVCRDSMQSESFTLSEHNAINTYSNQVYKGVYSDCSFGLFENKILISKRSFRSISLQKNNNLILSNNSYISSSPGLEIYEDHAKCSHGVTFGDIGSSILFYMESRCINHLLSKQMIAESFGREMLDMIDDKFFMDLLLMEF